MVPEDMEELIIGQDRHCDHLMQTSYVSLSLVFSFSFASVLFGLLCARICRSNTGQMSVARGIADECDRFTFGLLCARISRPSKVIVSLSLPLYVCLLVSLPARLPVLLLCLLCVLLDGLAIAAGRTD